MIDLVGLVVQVISTLEREIKELRRRHNLHAAAAATDTEGRGAELCGSSSALSGQNARFPSKFTGFRHMQNKTLNGVTTISGLRGAAGAGAGTSGAAPSACSGNSSVSSYSTSTHRSSSSSGAAAKSGHSSSSSSSAGSAHPRNGGPRTTATAVSGAASASSDAPSEQPVSDAVASSVQGCTELSSLPLNVVLSMFPMVPPTAAKVPHSPHLVTPAGIYRGISTDCTERCSVDNKDGAGNDHDVHKSVSVRCGSSGTGSTTSESDSGSPVPNPASSES